MRAGRGGDSAQWYADTQDVFVLVCIGRAVEDGVETKRSRVYGRTSKETPDRDPGPESSYSIVYNTACIQHGIQLELGYTKTGLRASPNRITHNHS